MSCERSLRINWCSGGGIDDSQAGRVASSWGGRTDPRLSAEHKAELAAIVEAGPNRGKSTVVAARRSSTRHQEPLRGRLLANVISLRKSQFGILAFDIRFYGVELLDALQPIGDGDFVASKPAVTANSLRRQCGQHGSYRHEASR